MKCRVEGGLEDIRKHIECKQADIVARSDYTEHRQAVLSVPSETNLNLERFYSDKTEEDLFILSIMKWDKECWNGIM